ncbi:cytochrome P450 [Actinocorallia sp. A-T 12471]|uniref:cytochrome P450 n=1 Tax=Actinocorallia sp. A-T 12471 TaxID=3089813 RepID=UPI0029CAFDB2|nr:cytochrome P450 [Actinocorallia sp. A-T 12471]MDX6741473.1 cytochrome P450 [Actinocorallia sp. A-T 12471]
MIDVSDAAFYRDPHAELARLRAETPVYWSEPAQMWVLTRHAHVMEASRDQARFCSRKGVLLGDRQREISEGQSILYMDPPDHVHYRRIVLPQFHRRRVSQLHERIRQLTVALLDAIAPDEPFDVVEQLAVPLPLALITELLGVPAEPEGMRRLREWSDVAMRAAVDPSDENLIAAMDIAVYFQDLLDRRRAEGGDDLIVDLVHAEADGKALSDFEIVGFCISLLVAGNETTRNLIAGGLRALAEHPDQAALLRADPQLIPTGVEEMLRWVSPFSSFARTATEEVKLDGTTIREGDYVLMMYLSANRDETVFGPTADRFDVTRNPNPHLSFGHGGHYCLGAPLARMEMQVVLTEVLTRFSGLRLAGEPRRTESAFVNGLDALPMVFESS